MRKRVNISLDTETIKKLKELAKNSHKTASQWIADKIWEESRAMPESPVNDK